MAVVIAGMRKPFRQTSRCVFAGEAVLAAAGTLTAGWEARRSRLPDAAARALRHPVAPYGFAVASVLAAVTASALIDAAVGHFMNFPFYAAVVASACFGTGAGLLSVALSVLVVGDLWTPPLFDLHIAANELPMFIAFVMFALMSLAWSAQRRRAHRVLETTVRTRTAELERANAALQIQIAEREAAEEDRRRTERALRDAEAELARALRLATVAEIAAAVAHEINQPLGAIVANGAACSRALAQQPPMLDLARVAADCVVADGHRAGDVITRIRALFNKEPPKWLLLDLNDVVRQVLEMSRGACDRAQVIANTELSESPPLVMGDPVQLQQILLNLVTNAVEAMAELPNCRRLLSIRSEIINGDTVRVAVEDCGHGLDEEQIALVFAGFYTTKPNGIGIGLSISRTIAEAHGGSLTFLPGASGATFGVSLPLAREARKTRTAKRRNKAALRSILDDADATYASVNG